MAADRLRALRHNGVREEHRLDSALAAAGFGLDDIKAVVISHLHLDHAGWWRSYRFTKQVVEHTGARLVFGHDAEVLSELRKERFYD